MSLFVGFIHGNIIYMAADGRFARDIPIVGIKYYDYSQKLGWVGTGDSLWMVDVGFVLTSEKIVADFEKRGISNIDELASFKEEYFKQYHEEALKYYGEKYEGPDDICSSVTLLFGGMDKNNKAKFCMVDSAKGYKQEWYGQSGDFMFNRSNSNKRDTYLRESLLNVTKEVPGKNDKYIIKKLKEIFLYVSRKEKGVSPLMYFVKISPEKTEYKEFRRVRKFFYRVKANFDEWLYIKVLKLDKLKRKCKELA